MNVILHLFCVLHCICMYERYLPVVIFVLILWFWVGFRSVWDCNEIYVFLFVWLYLTFVLVILYCDCLLALLAWI